jgi:hypothetical protein
MNGSGNITVQVRHTYVNVPVELTHYIYAKKLVTPFALYLFLKMYSDGKIHQGSPVITEMRCRLRLKDNRTFNKHIEKAKALNWVGFNPKSGYYFVRSFDHLRFKLGLNNRQGTRFESKNLSNVTAYIVGVIVSANIHGQKYAVESLQKKLARTEVKQRDASKQPNKGLFVPPYFGLCNEKIAKLLDCSVTRACQLKHAAESLGYIQTKAQFKPFVTLFKSDYQLRSNFEDGYPAMKGRLRFFAGRSDGKAVVQVLVQVYDEIIPMLAINRLPKFSNLRVTAYVRMKGSIVPPPIAVNPIGSAMFSKYMRRKGSRRPNAYERIIRDSLQQVAPLE